MAKRLNVGLVGLGRMGRVYANDLAFRVPNARLAAVADQRADAASAMAAELGVPKHYGSHHELLADKEIDAVVIITSTHTHGEMVMDAAKSGKAIFCEKPISLSLDEAEKMVNAVDAARVFFQMGFQRRFDSGYLGAKKAIEAGTIGTPVLLKSTSRDPFPPPLEFCNPKVSGGLILDMGIHDFDVARMFMGEVKSVFASGGALAYPEMKTVGDIDNAVVNMVFVSGALGSVDLSRTATFGYDIRAEIMGTKGVIQIGYHRHTPILVMTQAGITHDVVPHFMERFENAYLVQIRDFVDRVLSGQQPSITGRDAIQSLRISVAAVQSLKENRPVDVQ